MTHVSRPCVNWKLAMVKADLTSCLWGISIFFDKYFFCPQAVHIHKGDLGGGGGGHLPPPLRGGGGGGGKKKLC